MNKLNNKFISRKKEFSGVQRVMEVQEEGGGSKGWWGSRGPLKEKSQKKDTKYCLLLPNIVPFSRQLGREAAKKSSFLNGRSIKRGGG